MEVANQLVLITGGSRGIGRAIALALGSAGWKPLIAYCSQQALAEQAAAECGGIAAPFGADLSSRQQAERLWDWASGLGEIRGLVNNAGIYRPVKFAEATLDELESNFSLHWSANFMSAVWLTKLFAESASPGCRVLNVCSRVGFRGEAGAAGYAVSKAAQVNLVRSLAVELAPRGIGVFGIAPGWVETAMVREGMEARRAEILAGIPLGRVATAEDCAAVAAFLMTEAAAYLSGVVIDINGASYFH